MAVTLNNIRDNKGARHRKMTVGRGIGSGKGKTSGRGGKGQTARTGVAINGFEGGQTPIHRRLPKRGFNNSNLQLEIVVINTGDIQRHLDSGKLSGKKINAEILKNAKVLKRVGDGLKLLAKGEVKSALTIEVSYASEAAIAQVKKAGGEVVLLAKPAASAEGKKEKAVKTAPKKSTES